MMIHIILPVIAVAFAVLFIAGGLVRLTKKGVNGYLFLATGFVALGWALLRVIQKGFSNVIDPRTLPCIDHYASMLAGAGIALAIMLFVQEKMKKGESK